jgi:DNA-binding Lrp family transcriptional regulator
MTAIDETDRRILNQLQRDCALTNQELAERVHVSAPTCLRRVRRLIEAAVIERQVAIVPPEALGAGLTAIVKRPSCSNRSNGTWPPRRRSSNAIASRPDRISC